jgi:hypothetical protein
LDQLSVRLSGQWLLKPVQSGQQGLFQIVQWVQ